MNHHWKLVVVDLPDTTLVGTEDDVTAYRDYLTARGVECYRYRRSGDLAEWRYAG